MRNEHSMRRTLSLPLRVGLVAAVSALALTACGGSNSASPGPTGTTAPLPVKKATGTPVKVGLVSPEGGAQGSLPDVREAAQAAVQYVDQNLGGLAGHPIDLVVCKEKEDPASAHDCANQMVAAGVVAVLAPVTSQGDALVPTIAGAGIPYVTTVGTSTSEMTSADSFILTGGLPGSFGGTAAYAAEHNYKKVALLVEDAGSVMAGVQAMADPAFQQAGITVKAVGIPMGTPDTTPQVSAALADHPDAVLITGDGPLCTSVLQAMSTLGATAAKMAPQTCMGPDVLAAVGSQAVEGTHIIGDADMASSDPDSVLYRNVMATYAPKTSVFGYGYAGYQAALGLARAVQGVQGDFTPATVSAAIKAAQRVPLPLGHGLTFTCDGKQVPMLKAICGSGAIVTTVKDGKITDPQVVQ